MSATAQIDRFAILRHESPQGLHWDLLLEAGGGSLPHLGPTGLAGGRGRSDLPGPARSPACVSRLRGPISGGRGSVVRWDHGTYQLHRDNADALAIQISGTKLTGEMLLERMPENPGQWRLRWGKRARGRAPPLTTFRPTPATQSRGFP